MIVTATAVASAMRIRTAPPFVGRALARLALLGVGGLRPSHSRPERRAGRHRPFWLIAAGCAAGVYSPVIASGSCPLFVLSWGLKAGALKPCLIWRDPIGGLLRVMPPTLRSPHLPERPIGLCKART